MGSALYKDMSSAFEDCRNLREVQGGGGSGVLGTVTDFSRMFKNCINLERIDSVLGKDGSITGVWDFSSARSLSEMFSGCKKLSFGLYHPHPKGWQLYEYTLDRLINYTWPNSFGLIAQDKVNHYKYTNDMDNGQGFNFEVDPMES